MQKECRIVRDLLPNYMEKLTGDVTNTVVEEHLKQCTDCQEYYKKLEKNTMEEQASEREKNTRFGRTLRRYRYQLFGGFIGVALTVVLFFLMIVGGIRLINRLSYEKGHTEDTEAYGLFKGYSGLSKLALFPEDSQLEAYGATVKEYYFDCLGPKLYQSCEIYAECKFDEKAFLQEVRRLKAIKNSETGKTSVYEEMEYAFPAVYTMRNAEGCNEYALLCADDFKIIYIYLQGAVDRREIHFPEEYLPPDYGQDGMSFEEVEVYTIYETEDEKNN